MNSRELGYLGEHISSKFLLKHNYNIIRRNFYYKGGEIDIIAIDCSTNELVFFEVKTRANLKYGKPMESINNVKMNNIIKGARYFLYMHDLSKAQIRFDIVEVYYIKHKFFINHIKQVI